MKKYLVLMLEAIVLTGCIKRPPEQQPPEQVEMVQQQQPEVVAPPAPPKIQTLNWEGSVAPLIAQMLKESDAAPGSILLVNSVKNNTNGSLLIAKATMAIYDALSNGKAFILVPCEQMSVAKQTLGLSADDSLGSRSKAIGLARYVGAQYLLYSDVIGDVKTPQLDIQLILVQSGEIVWSGNGAAQ
ncbi:MAG: penicillin-binding protein activator LpoB [Candidatus Malihini olakiniferum]